MGSVLSAVTRPMMSARVVMAEMSGQGSWPHDQNNGSGSGKVG